MRSGLITLARFQISLDKWCRVYPIPGATVVDLETLSATSSTISDVNEHFKSFFALEGGGRGGEGKISP